MLLQDWNLILQMNVQVRLVFFGAVAGMYLFYLMFACIMEIMHKPLFYVLIYLNLVPWLENTLGPTFWKPALLLIAVASAVLLSLKIFSRPFDAVLRFGRKPATPLEV